MRLARQKNPRSRWRAEKPQKQMLSNLSANFMEEEQEASKPELPDALLHFLKENGLDPSIYPESHSTPRYIRIKPGLEARIEEIETEIKWKLEEVEWLPGFYALPPDVQVANSNAYREGKVRRQIEQLGCLLLYLFWCCCFSIRYLSWRSCS